MYGRRDEDGLDDVRLAPAGHTEGEREGDRADVDYGGRRRVRMEEMVGGGRCWCHGEGEMLSLAVEGDVKNGEIDEVRSEKVRAIK